jgi:hypothetical protein
MKLVLALSSLLVFGAACATAGPGADQTSSAVIAAPADAKDAAGRDPQASAPKDDLVCRMEAEVGTHLKKKVCRSRTQREREAREAQDAIRRGQTGSRPSFQD